MKEIPNELLKKYYLAPKEKYVSEISFYTTFLKQTDYLALKLAEGLIIREDKKEEFDARDFARAEINRLQAEK